jgi:YbbR domain-containing protein
MIQTRTLRFVVDNIVWLLGSLALAIVVWYAAVSTTDPVEQRRFRNPIPIQIRASDGMLVVEQSDAQAQITLRTLSSTWETLDTNNFRIVADVSTLEPGTHRVPLNVSFTDERIRGTVIETEPPTIQVTLARRRERQMPLTIETVQDPPIGFAANVTLSEPTTLISGAEDRVEQVDRVVARLNLVDQRESTTRTVSLIPLNAQGRVVSGVTVQPAEVVADIQISQRPGTTQLIVFARIEGDPPFGYEVIGFDYEPKVIVVRGDEAAIDNLNGIVYTDLVNVRGRTESFTQPVQVILPTGVVQPDPQLITVTVTIQPILQERTLNGIPVQIGGLDPADYLITARPDQVSVTVSGAQAVVDSILPDDITVIAPLAGLDEGEHEIALQAMVNKPEITSENVTISPATVTVQIVRREPAPTVQGTEAP